MSSSTMGLRNGCPVDIFVTVRESTDAAWSMDVCTATGSDECFGSVLPAPQKDCTVFGGGGRLYAYAR